MAKTNPIGVRFNEELLEFLKESEFEVTAQKALSMYEESFMREFSISKATPQIFIYKLINPINQKVFYIGRTIFMLHQRLGLHIGQRNSKSPGVNQAKSAVINEILSSGNRPIIELIEAITPLSDSEYRGHHEREVYWIAKMYLDGQPLTNKIPDKSKEIILKIKENNKPGNKARIEAERNTVHNPITWTTPAGLEEMGKVEVVNPKIAEYEKELATLGTSGLAILRKKFLLKQIQLLKG